MHSHLSLYSYFFSAIYMIIANIKTEVSSTVIHTLKLLESNTTSFISRRSSCFLAIYLVSFLKRKRRRI